MCGKTACSEGRAYGEKKYEKGFFPLPSFAGIARTNIDLLVHTTAAEGSQKRYYYDLFFSLQIWRGNRGFLSIQNMTCGFFLKKNNVLNVLFLAFFLIIAVTKQKDTLKSNIRNCFCNTLTDQFATFFWKFWQTCVLFSSPT